ncbi:inositol monophosphatase [Aquihabitans sp. G128]|uniref:inositol monophosphatase family protein n=1 Tax=Aquihabitans sp. G128 TaxID=2849779 RepID=UPI001C23F120|nr:inositol monophosphatase [Aquihabitans sp. G128]QXC62775.1 inositol monophosphatase [Aquihabitans sp. G128]
MERAELVAQVGAAVRAVAAEVVLPRFGALTAAQIHEKEPGDLVTDADREAEAALSERLRELLPGAAVVGEEAVAADPGVLERAAAAERAWVIDPIDGTSNFVAASPDFAVMVALVERGETTAGWIHHPVSDRMFTATRGGGAQLDGTSVRRRPAPSSSAELRGVLRTRYLEPAAAARAIERSAAFAHVDEGRKAAGIEYPRVVLGEIDFVLYLRTHVWDHAAGALILEEAGGRAARLDGTTYRPFSDAVGLVLAADDATRARATEAFAPAGEL